MKYCVRFEVQFFFYADEHGDSSYWGKHLNPKRTFSHVFSGFTDDTNDDALRKAKEYVEKEKQSDDFKNKYQSKVDTRYLEEERKRKKKIIKLEAIIKRGLKLGISLCGDKGYLRRRVIKEGKARKFNN